jgi:hypothetical protein
MRYAILALLVACGSKSATPATPKNASPSPSPDPQPAAASCAVTGCSGSVCAKAGADIVTTCEMQAEYACYAKAECKMQPSGECGWTMDAPLKACLANPPPLK